MSDQFSGYDDAAADAVPFEDPVDEPSDSGAAAEALRTGNAAVDEVLGSVEALDDRRVEEHAQVFERAHEQLRGALDRPQDS